MENSNNKEAFLWNITDNQIIRSYLAGPSQIDPFGQASDAIRYKDIMPLSGGYNIEYWSGIPTQWIGNASYITVHTNKAETIVLSFNALSYSEPRTIWIYLDDKEVSEQAITTSFTKIDITSLKLQEGAHEFAFCSFNDSQYSAYMRNGNDSNQRYLCFAIQNVSISASKT